MSAALAVALACLAFAQPKNPAPVWSVDGFEQPESAHYDPGTNAVYVSNVAGEPSGQDGRGWISKLDPAGKVLKRQWVKGLDAPKALRACGGRLYVADVDDLVEISLSSAAVTARIPLRDAKLLNGLAVDEKCAVYVSDTFASRIYRVSAKREVTILAEGPTLQSPNGLVVEGKSLFAAAWGLTKDWTTAKPGRLLKIGLGASPAVSALPGPIGNLDGLARWKGDWLVSDWASGAVYRVMPNGQSVPLLHGFDGPADIGVARGLLLVPRMKENRVDAYRLPQRP